MSGHSLLFSQYTLIWEIVHRLGLARTPLLGRFLVRPAGKIVRRCFAHSIKSDMVEIHGHKMRLGAELLHKMEESFDPLRHYRELVSGEFETPTTTFFESYLKPGMTVIDIGANIGYYTLLSARCVGPKGRVYAFEPHPGNFRLLCENIEINGYANVTPLPQAVSNQRGSMRLYLSDEDIFYHSLYRVPFVSDKSVSVEATSLDDFFEAEGWPDIDLVKIDIEGGELAALSGMQKLLERNSTLKLVVEYNPDTLAVVGATGRDLVELLASYGFTSRALTSEGSEVVHPAQVENIETGTNLLCERLGAQT